MKQSNLFTKTRKEAPRDEEAKNAQLLIRAGFIYKEFAGVYTFLPLGLRVIEKISQIIKNEMNAIGGVEMRSSALQQKKVWEKTRWDEDVIFKTELKNGTDVALAFTHEEPKTSMMKDYISSYKDLPVYPYDITTVFRNEARAKSGILRTREFLWKALYSFSKDKAQHDEFYEKAKIAYKNIFEKTGLGKCTYLTFASGGSFAKYSHEFQTVSDAGEDIIYVDEKSGIAINKDVYTDEVIKNLGLKKKDLVEKKAIETGNIFSLGERYSEPLGLKYKDEEGKEKNVFMGSYGIGIPRLIGAIVEKYCDDNGLIWPESIAPFRVHLLTFGKNENIFREAENIYHDLKNAGIEVLFDDRDFGPGQKLNDADLIGIPYRIVVSEKAAENGGIEVKRRDSDEIEFVSADRILSYLLNKDTDTK